MRSYTLGNLKLVLNDLIDKRGALLDATKSGRLYRKALEEKRAKINALPEALTTSRPHSEALAAADVDHDGIGLAILNYAQAVQAHPGLPPEQRAAAARVQAAFVPESAVLRASYADEATAAIDNRPKLQELEVDLKRLPAPIVDEDGKEAIGSLYDWAEDFVDAGDVIGTLLADRAQINAGGKVASEAGALRGATMGLLGRFRGALRDEIAMSAELAEGDPEKVAPEVEAQVFAYFDELGRALEESAKRRGRRQKKGEAAKGEAAKDEAAAKSEEPIVADGEA